MKTTKNAGFTLVELMIVMAFIGMIIAIALPGVSNTVKRYTLSNDMRVILADINKARSNAMRTCKNTSIQFIPAPVGGRLTYIVFVDNSANGIYNAAVDGNPLKRGSIHSGITVTLAFKTFLNNRQSVMFNNLGLPWGFNGGVPVTYDGSLTATATVGDGSTVTKTITVNTGGNVTIN